MASILQKTLKTSMQYTFYAMLNKYQPKMAGVEIGVVILVHALYWPDSTWAHRHMEELLARKWFKIF